MIMHIDMNSFFASVEQQINPSLRGKPVVVLAYMGKRGVVLASSIEAKREYGIRTGMILADARARCAQVVAMTSTPGKYRLYSAAFMQLCRQYSPQVEQYSIDEAFLNIDWVARTPEQALALAHEIKHRISKEIGDWIKASIGIAPTRFLAKLAGDSMKPDGLVMLGAKDIPQWYRNRDIQSAWGIGPGVARKLRRIGVYTLYDLYGTDSITLFRLFGKTGHVLWSKLHGVEVEELQTDRVTDQKSISAQYSLPFRTTSSDALRGVLMKMCERVGRRMRRQNKHAGRVFCFWRCRDGSGQSAHEDVLPHCSESYAIFGAATRMFSAQKVISPYRLIGVGVSKLGFAGGQQRLFIDERAQKVTSAMDKINNKYGEYSVFYGAMASTQSYAQEQVGFRKIS